MGTDKIILRYVYHKPFMSNSLTSVTARTGLTQSIKEAWSGMWIVWRPMKALVSRCINGALKKRHSLSLGLHTTVFQTFYAIKACIMKNTGKGYKGRSIFILADSQVATKVLNNFQINSKLVWDCCKSLVKMAECKNRTGMGAGTYVNCWGMQQLSFSQTRLLMSTHRT